MRWHPRFSFASVGRSEGIEALPWLDDWKGTPADPVPAFVNSSEAFQTWSRAYDQEHPGWQGPDPDQQRQEWLDEEYRYEHLHASERVRPERNYTLHLIHG